MSIWPWIGAVVGWHYGGFFGAAAGAALASLLTKRSETASSEAFRTPPDPFRSARRSAPPPPPPPPRRASDADIASAFMALVAALMKADGHATRDELACVKRFLSKTYPPAVAQSALAALRELLKEEIPVARICSSLRSSATIAQRRVLFHLLYEVAYADSVFHPREKALLDSIAPALGISPADTRSIAAAFERASASRDYDILGVSPSASDEEVRRAFRRMAMKNHPDKVASLGPEFQQAAADKFRTINEAYERIRKSRGVA